MKTNLAVSAFVGPQIKLSTGLRVTGPDAKKLTPVSGSWESVVESVLASRELPLSRTQYLAKPEPERQAIKLGQPYMLAGPTKGKRGAGCLLGRSMITIDIDGGEIDVVEKVTTQLETLDYEALVHQTISHSALSPRIRIIVPLLEEIDVDDYGLAARILASQLVLGMAGVDTKSFVGSQVMFLPSHFIGEPPIWIRTHGDFYDALDELTVWQGEAPRVPSEGPVTASTIPSGTSKNQRGVIGAFCRAYSPQEAIKQFLPGFYELAQNGRLRRVGSKSMGGVVFFDDKVYSHHSHADPLARPGDDGKVHSHNAFDAVWLHRGGSLSEMVKWAASLPEVQAIMEEDSLSVLPHGPDGGDCASSGHDPEECWRKSLDLQQKTKRILGNLNNVTLIMRNYFKGCIALNLLDEQIHITKSFLGIEAGRRLVEWDVVCIRLYLEKELGLLEVSKRNLQDGILMAALDAAFHPIRDYLNSLTWDGQPRIDTWLKVIGAELTPYVREAGRLLLVAAVTRVFEPGAKFDSCLVLVTPQGGGKGLLLKALGGAWYRELSSDFHDTNKMIESTQSGWLVEMAELRGVSRADQNTLKSYITRANDAARLAYGHESKDRPRQFVIVGTSNETDFLGDDTGERRWWPIRGTKSAEDPIEIPKQVEVDQLWAEALAGYRKLRVAQPHGDLPLFLSKEARAEAALIAEDFKALSAGENLASQIAQWAEEPYQESFTPAEAWCGVRQSPGAVANKSDTTLIGNAMKLLESRWEKTRPLIKGRRTTVYSRKP